MTEKIQALNWLLALAGAAGGGAAGFFVFYWLYHRGLYAAILPGAALGIAGGALLRCRSQAFGIICGVLALLLGVFSHWWIRIPGENKEPGYLYLLTHLNHISSIYLIMIVLGTLCGYWFGQGREKIPERQSP
jgi:hypothetical protein